MNKSSEDEDAFLIFGCIKVKEMQLMRDKYNALAGQYFDQLKQLTNKLNNYNGDDAGKNKILNSMHNVRNQAYENKKLADDYHNQMIEAKKTIRFSQYSKIKQWFESCPCELQENILKISGAIEEFPDYLKIDDRMNKRALIDIITIYMSIDQTGYSAIKQWYDKQPIEIREEVLAEMGVKDFPERKNIPDSITMALMRRLRNKYKREMKAKGFVVL